MEGTAVALLTRWLNRLGNMPPTPKPASSTPPTRSSSGAASTARACRRSPIRQASIRPSCTTTSDPRRDLARAVWLRIASSFVPGIFQMLGSDISLDEKIDRFVDAYHTRLAKHPYLLGYVISEAARHPDFVDDFYSAERRKAARRSLERVRTSRSTNAPSGIRSRLSRLISSS